MDVLDRIRPQDVLRFHSKIMVDVESGCHLWMAAANKYGYGQFQIKRGGWAKLFYAHRFAWLVLHGWLPAKPFELDHLCRNPRCANPAHLEVVTHRVNTLRGDAVSAVHARKTHCVNGHPFDAKNTYLRPDTGTRACKECGKTRNRAAAKLRLAG